MSSVQIMPCQELGGCGARSRRHFAGRNCICRSRLRVFHSGGGWGVWIARHGFTILSRTRRLSDFVPSSASSGTVLYVLPEVDSRWVGLSTLRSRSVSPSQRPDQVTAVVTITMCRGSWRACRSAWSDQAGMDRRSIAARVSPRQSHPRFGTVARRHPRRMPMHQQSRSRQASGLPASSP